jgi:hypothetical protein
MGVLSDAILFYGVSFDPGDICMPCDCHYELEEYIGEKFGFNYLEMNDIGIGIHCSDGEPMPYFYCTLSETPKITAIRGNPKIARIPALTKEVIEWGTKLTDFLQHFLEGDTDEVSPINWYLVSYLG